MASRHPKCHRQDLLWDRRDQQDQQRLGLQKDPAEEARVGGRTPRAKQAQPQQSLRAGSGVPRWPQRPPKEPHPAAGLSAEIPKTTYGGSGQTLQSGEAAVALQPSLSSLSSLTLVTARPLGTLGAGKGPRQARDGRPLPKAPRTPRVTRGTCQWAQHHSPACLERQQDRRDPWALVHPAGRKEGVKRSRDGGRAKRCQHPETPTASGPGGRGLVGGHLNQPHVPHCCSQPCWNPRQ